MEPLFAQIRHAVRSWRNDPIVAGATFLTLVVGIGATTAVFSVVDAVLFRPLPYKNPSRIVRIVGVDPRDPDAGVRYEHFQALQSAARSFEAIAVYYRNTGWSRVTLTSGEPEAVQAAFTSASLFRVLGVAPIVGRVFTPDEEQQAERVAVLSHGQWARRFAASRDVIGSTVDIDGERFTIVGVMPDAFQFPVRDSQLWLPITTNRFWLERLAPDPSRNPSFFRRWNLVAALKPGVSVDRARAEVTSIVANLGAADASLVMDRGVSVARIDSGVSDASRRALQLWLAAVAALWLMACSNVTTLLLARGAARTRELAVRRALGAGTSRIVEEMLVEIAVLLAASASVSLIVAMAAVRALEAFGPLDIPRFEQAGLHGRTFVFMAVLTLATAGIIAIVPAWNASHRDPSEALKSGGRGNGHDAGRAPAALVAAQFGFGCLLLVTMGLLLRTLVALEAVDLGFRPDPVLTMRVTLPDRTPAPTRMRFYDQLIDRLRGLPAVEAIGGIAGLFENAAPPTLGFRAVEGRVAESRDRWTALTWTTVSGDYFKAIGVRLLRGRVFAAWDTFDSPLVAVVDESLAARYWPGEDPIGRRFKGQDARRNGDEWLTVIGVVEDMRRQGRENRPSPHVFEWQPQSHATTADIVIKASGDPSRLAAAARAAVRAENPTAVIASMATMNARLDDQLATRRFHVWLLAAFALIAVVLACTGIYGVMHHGVARRRHELGIRIALGASRRRVIRMVLTQGALVAACGVASGVIASWWLTRLLASLLYGVAPTDPLTFAGAIAVMMSVGLAATALPAWRASLVDPMIALKD